MLTKILYIDDEYPNRIMFKLAYRGELDVLLANSADEGLTILKSNPDIDVVITDMRMPHKDGLELVSEARKFNNGIPYCLLTGFGITPEIQSALDSKLIDQYFKKPFEKNSILSFIKNKVA